MEDPHSNVEGDGERDVVQYTETRGEMCDYALVEDGRPSAGRFGELSLFVTRESC